MSFWVLWACLAMSTKKTESTCRNLWCLSTCKKSTWSLSFLEELHFEESYNLIGDRIQQVKTIWQFFNIFFLNGHKNVTILRLKKKYQEIDQTLKLKKNELCGVIFWLIAKLDIYSCNFTSSFFYIFEMWKYHSKRQNCG